MALRRILNTGHYKLITPIDTPGIYHNSDLGLISLSSDGTTRITISDKNLGATQVYNSGDTLSEANCGKYYQWGNNYGFAWTGSITTSSTKVNASTYGPGNYYNSSTFIYRASSPRGWDSSNNTNLRGGDTGTVSAMQGPCPDGFHISAKSEWDNISSILTSLGFSQTGIGDIVKGYLKMPYGGSRASNSANIQGQGSWGAYSSSTATTTNGYSYQLTFAANSFNSSSTTATPEGNSIRPFKNEAVQPDDSRTKLY